MNKIWFTVLYVVWGLLYAMIINGANEIAIEEAVQPIARIFSSGINAIIFGALLWTLLYFRYKNAGVNMTWTDNIFILLSAIVIFFSLVVLYRGLKATAVNNLNDIEVVDVQKKSGFITSFKNNVVGLVYVAGYGTVIIGGFITYIYNIIEMFRNHELMTNGALFFGIAGVMFPPLGCIRGFLYLLGY